MLADVSPLVDGGVFPDGDELVLKRSEQCLPRYLVHFKRIPKRRRDEDIPLEMRNVPLIILWVDPNTKVFHPLSQTQPFLINHLVFRFLVFCIFDYLVSLTKVRPP